MKKLILALTILFSANSLAAELSFEETWDLIQKTMRVHSVWRHDNGALTKGLMLNNPEINDPCYAIIVTAWKNGTGDAFSRTEYPIDFTILDFENHHKFSWRGPGEFNQILYLDSSIDGNSVDDFYKKVYYGLDSWTFVGGVLDTAYPTNQILIPAISPVVAERLMKAFKHLAKLCKSPF